MPVRPTRMMSTVEVGDWVRFNWGPWRQIVEVKERTRFWVVLRLAKLDDLSVEVSCAPDIQFPWHA